MYLILVDLFPGLFRVCWLRPEMPFLELLISTYWQEGRAVANCTLESCVTQDIRSAGCRRADELPSPCARPHALPQPQVSAGWGRKVKRTEEQKPLYTSGRGRGRKGMKCLTQLFPGEISFLPLRKDDFQILALSKAWNKCWGTYPGGFEGQHCHQLGSEDFSIQN